MCSTVCVLAPVDSAFIVRLRIQSLGGHHYKHPEGLPNYGVGLLNHAYYFREGPHNVIVLCRGKGLN